MSCANDNWRPSASLPVLQQRAKVLRAIREYFYQNKVLEVEPPIICGAATLDLHIQSFVSQFHYHGQPQKRSVFLHTSPEFPMKRLLSAGYGDIYYLGKVFRNGDLGRRHNPEFTMLEWYRLGFDHHQLMGDLSALLQSFAPFKEKERLPYAELFARYFNLNPHQLSAAELQKLVNRYVDASLYNLSEPDSFDLLFSHIIEPELGAEKEVFHGVYVYDYPASMSALAKIITDNQGNRVAARFELFSQGVELANGYHELTDAQEQKNRFLAENKKRQESSYPVYPYDANLIEALEQGMPECAGVALGIDRLLMLLFKESEIKRVISFGFDQA